MIVPNVIRKCVVFIGYKMANGSMRMAGSGFFLGREPTESMPGQIFLVIAKHVIDGIRRLGLDEIYVRVNLKDGTASWLKADGAWSFHPDESSVDVAILETGIPEILDHMAISHSLCVDETKLTENEVGLGDEVFVVGLFKHHTGERRNIPIVRVGNLAAMAEEKVGTREFGLMDAYLVEARSIGGLSGSAVFLNLGVVRAIGGQVKTATSGTMFFLLGLIHGHFDVQSTAVDAAESDSADSVSTEKINTGIAIVVPMHKIFEAIDAYNSAR